MSDLRTYRVDGMSCEGCVRSVTNALRRASPSAHVEVDLAAGTLGVSGIGNDESVREAVEGAGFTYRGPAC